MCFFKNGITCVLVIFLMVVSVLLRTAVVKNKGVGTYTSSRFTRSPSPYLTSLNSMKTAINTTRIGYSLLVNRYFVYSV